MTDKPCRDLGFVCQICGGRTRSNLDDWEQWYTAGEQWHEDWELPPIKAVLP
ncbi:MAG: hypothetical protein ACR2NT_09610 [Acidimicrobiia bacterium]